MKVTNLGLKVWKVFKCLATIKFWAYSPFGGKHALRCTGPHCHGPGRDRFRKERHGPVHKCACLCMSVYVRKCLCVHMCVCGILISASGCVCMSVHVCARICSHLGLILCCYIFYLLPQRKFADIFGMAKRKHAEEATFGRDPESQTPRGPPKQRYLLSVWIVCVCIRVCIISWLSW